MRKFILFLSCIALLSACKTKKEVEKAPVKVRPQTEKTDDSMTGSTNNTNKISFKGNWSGDWQITKLGAFMDASDMGVTMNVDKEKRRISGNTSCNSYFANMSTEGPQIWFTGVGGTEKACDDRKMRTEQALYNALNGAVTFSFVEKNSIQVYDSGGAVLMTMKRLR